MYKINVKIYTNVLQANIMSHFKLICVIALTIIYTFTFIMVISNNNKSYINVKAFVQPNFKFFVFL
jgi:hypothetical protein